MNGESSKINSASGRAWLLGGISVVVLPALFYGLFWNRYFGINLDGWFQFFGTQMLKGQVPYRDFYLFTNPLHVLESACLTALFGTHWWILRTVAIAQRSILALIAFVWLKKAGYSPAAATAGEPLIRQHRVRLRQSGSALLVSPRFRLLLCAGRVLRFAGSHGSVKWDACLLATPGWFDSRPRVPHEANHRSGHHARDADIPCRHRLEAVGLSPGVFGIDLRGHRLDRAAGVVSRVARPRIGFARVCRTSLPERAHQQGTHPRGFDSPAAHHVQDRRLDVRGSHRFAQLRGL